MIADEVDRPGADEDDRCNHRDDSGADHDVAPFDFAGISQVPPKANRSGEPPGKLRSPPRSSGYGYRYAVVFEEQSGRIHNLVKCTVTIEPNRCFKMFSVETLHE